MQLLQLNSVLKIFEHGPAAAFARLLASSLVNICPHCQQSPIVRILSEVRREMPFCLYCYPSTIIANTFLRKVLKLNDEEFQRFTSNTLYTRSVVAWLRGVGRFGVSKPQPTLPPIAIVWNFTYKCNLKCIHCYQDSHSVFDENTHSIELSTSEALRVVDIIAKSGCGSLSFSGGEPLIRDDFYEIAKRTSKRRLLCTLSTNGTMIDQTVAKDIADTGVTGISISLDSYSSSFHDELRGVKGAHAKALQGIEVCSEIDQFKELIIAVTLTNRNIKEIPDLIELASELGATRLYVSRILPVGRGKALSHLNVNPTEQKSILKDLSEFFVNYAKTGKGVAVMTRGMTYFAPQCAKLSNYEIFPISEIVIGFEKRHEEIMGKSAKKLFRQFAEYAGGCATGITYCGLSPEGNILPCAPVTHIHLGNILENGLENIWINNPVLRTVRNRSQVRGKCGKCTHNFICGGCRVTAYGESGDWLASDPSCPY
ncbi:MAG: radical SAM protein [Candidatus Heimdallarchaeota archaeon]|nr:MAG: radical SAM protein [Candidatus Heimdallarchaeota archaeon]